MPQHFSTRNVVAIQKEIQAVLGAGLAYISFNVTSNVPASFVTAEGYELLKPIPYRYQITDCKILTLGGNAAGGNLIITSANPNPYTIVTFLPAGLLQNSLLRVGAPNALVTSSLYSTSHENTSVKVASSGGAITGASSFIVSLDFSVFKISYY